MGIQSLFRLCESLSPKSFKRIPPTPHVTTAPHVKVRIDNRKRLQYDHVYYDVNNVIYTLLARAVDEEHFFIRLFHDIDHTLKKVASDRIKSLFLAVDGPGPRAKVSTQLARRRKVSFSPDNPLQRLAFTPGTVFMERMRAALNVYAASRATSARNNGFAVWVSGSDCPGEGENKCFNHMRLVPPHHQCLVIGNDSDLIPYALQAHCEVHIFREKGNQLINCKTLKHDLAAGITPRTSFMNQEEAEQRIADDFVFLAILIGNDYVPGLTSYLFEPTWENYRRLKLSKPATRTEFVFDATTKVVNWALVQSINGGLDFSSAGASEASKPNAQAHVSATAEHDDDAVVSARNATFGRLHPKSVVCELLMLGGDMPVFEDVPSSDAPAGTKTVRLTSNKGGWEVYGYGISQRDALIDVALAALAPGSSLLVNVVAKFPDQQRRKCAILLENMSVHFDEIRKWLVARGARVGNATIGNVPGFEFNKPAPLLFKQRSTDKSELYKAYLEGVMWSFEYYGGEVKNYGYCYGHRERVSMHGLLKAAPQLSSTWDATTASVPPLPPLVLGLCLLAGERRALLPPPFDKFEAETDRTVGHIFENDCELLTMNPEQLSTSLDEVEHFVSKMDWSKMPGETTHLLKLHRPTAFMDRTNPLLKGFTTDEINKLKYHPPTLPVGPFKRLQNAPPSDRVVAAVNLAKPSSRGWFTFDTPYMRKRFFGTSSLAPPVNSMSLVVRGGLRRLFRK